MQPLVIDNIKKNYGQIKAVDSVSFTVKEGEIFGLIGPDGAGKTSIMRMVVTMLRQNSGNIYFQGKEVMTNTAYVRANIGYMPQRFSLYPDLTVEQNLCFFGDLFGVTKKERQKKLKRLYEFSQLEPFTKRQAGALSGGMKQKLALCCALIHEPQMLILDEPTVGVDPVSREEFWRILHELAEKKVSILVSTSYMDEAAQCNRVGLIYEGKLLTVDEPQNLIKKFAYPIYYLKNTEPYKVFNLLKKTEYSSCVQLFGAGVHLLDKQKEGLDNIREKLKRYDIEADAIEQVAPQFEDVFLEFLRS